MEQILFDFMNERPLMVISTINKAGKPESAVVGFGQSKKLELITGTKSYTRKAHNIKHNSNVSVVIGWDEKGTLQYEGVARIVSGQEARDYAEIYYTKKPTARKHQDDPEETYVVITPRWIRFTELVYSPWRIHEIKY